MLKSTVWDFALFSSGRVRIVRRLAWTRNRPRRRLRFRLRLRPRLRNRTRWRDRDRPRLRHRLRVRPRQRLWTGIRRYLGIRHRRWSGPRKRPQTRLWPRLWPRTRTRPRRRRSQLVRRRQRRRFRQRQRRKARICPLRRRRRLRIRAANFHMSGHTPRRQTSGCGCVFRTDPHAILTRAGSQRNTLWRHGSADSLRVGHHARTTRTRAIQLITGAITGIRFSNRAAIDKPAGRHLPIRGLPRRPRKRISRDKLVNNKLMRPTNELLIPLPSGRWPEFRRRNRLPLRKRLRLIRRRHLWALRIWKRRRSRTRGSGTGPPPRRLPRITSRRPGVWPRAAGIRRWSFWGRFWRRAWLTPWISHRSVHLLRSHVCSLRFLTGGGVNFPSLQLTSCSTYP